MGLQNEGAKGRPRRSCLGVIFRVALRSLQLVMALVVLGMYGVDLNTARQNNIAGDTRWMYAETIAGLSGITAIVYSIPFVKSHFLFAWDTLLFIFWVAVFGTFGKIYLNADPAPGDDNTLRMKNAVWVDLFNMLLWFISAAYGAVSFFRHQDQRAKRGAMADEV